MKKNVIALLLSVVLAAGSIGTAPVFAAETTAEEAVAVEEEWSPEEAASEEIEDADAGLNVSEEEIMQAKEEESVQETEDNLEMEDSTDKQDEIAATEDTAEATAPEEEAPDSAEEGDTSLEIAEIVEPAEIEEEISVAEDNEAKAAVSGKCGTDATWSISGTTLTISGKYAMDDYSYSYDYYWPSDDDSDGWYVEYSDAPWFEREITKIVINEGITHIGLYAFAGMAHLKSITIPSSVTSIGYSAFYRCEDLTNITIPNSVTRIENSLFTSCSSLKSITLPSKLKYIDGNAFSGCRSLTNITIPNTVTEIGGGAFRGCSSLTSFKIPNSINRITARTFEDCKSLTAITIPDTVAEIRDEAFSGCSSLTSITIPPSVKRIGNHAFSGCESLNILYNGSNKQWEAINGSDKTEYKTITFSVDAGSFSVDADFELPKTAYNYTGNPVKPAVNVTYNGKQLVQDKDYNLTYENNISMGTATVNVNGIGSYSGTAKLLYRIRLGNPPKVTCTNVASGMKVNWERVSGATRYKVYRDGKLIFTTSALVVTDKEVKYKGGTKFVYKVVATEKNTGDSDLFKTATYYRLMPVGIKTLSNPSAGKMTVTYDKSTGSSGYVVRYGLKSDMSDAKVITVQGQNTLSRTFGGMQKGKTYYVQVRTYKIENGVRYYSGYCTTKTITIKK